MKKYYIYFRASLIVLAAFLVQNRFASARDEFPLAERFIKKNDIAGYERAAQTYLEKHADSEFSPRVALDLLMLSRIKNQESISEAMEAKLLLDYPETVQGAYLMTTYTKAEAYRSRLAKLLDQYVRAPSSDFPRKYRAVLGFGSNRFGKELFDDNDFLLKSASVMAVAGETEWQQTLLGYYKERAKEDDKLQRIAELAMDESRPVSERLPGVHEALENPTAGFIRDILLLRLSAKEKQTPEIRQVIAEALLDQKRFQPALSVLEQLPIDKNGDKVLFQRLWCHAVAGDLSQVEELQARLEKEYPASLWRERGHQVLQATKTAEKNLDLYADTLRTVVAAAKKDFDWIEASLSYRRWCINPPKLRCYAAHPAQRES